MKCPICKKVVDVATAGKPGSFFPFCSDRCKLIDLGRWLDGAYQVEVDTNDDEGQDESVPDAIRTSDPDRRGRPRR